MIAFVRRLVPAFVLSWYHLVWAWGSAVWYRFPSRKLTVIGVTGTNGKSSVVWLLTRMLEEAGHTVAATSSIEFQIGKKRWPNLFKLTMPGRWYLQKFLSDAVRERCTYVVMEATSEGMRQHRHRFIDFSVVVFLNLSPEHIERHGSYERYRAAKGELFRSLKPMFSTLLQFAEQKKTAVVNLSDKEAEYFLRFPAERVLGFRTNEDKAKAELPPGGEEFVAEEVQTSRNGVKFTLKGVSFSSSLLGAYNVENALAAATIAQAVGVPMKTCAQALAGVGSIPGRLEEIGNDRGLRIFVDYAHTPMALKGAYETLAPVGKSLICVLGAAGGGRDQWKRKELGKLAAEACREIIVTDEDPYDEDPATIRRAVVDGALQHQEKVEVAVIPDRREAIAEALKRASSGDVVVITGKGCEPWMVVRHGKKIPWDDRKVVREELKRLASSD